MQETFLDAAGCPICALGVEAEASFFRWFDIESFAEVRLHERLRRSAGFCPRHDRRALKLGHLTPLPSIARGAVELLDDEHPRGACPACAVVDEASRHGRELLVDVLANPRLLERYRSRRAGACVTHALGALQDLDAEAAPTLVGKLLGDLSAGARLTVLAGDDPDAPQRALLRAGLAPLPVDRAASTAELELVRWRVEACPACHAGRCAERRYLEWRRHQEHADSRELDRDPGVLCAAHLSDLAAVDREAAQRAAEHAAAWWTGELQRALTRRPEAPAGSRWNGRRRPSTDPLKVPATFCPACRAVSEAESRHLELLLRLLALAPNRHAYDAGHGVCLRHGLAAIDGRPATVHVRTGLRARLAILAWEIDEARHRQRWDQRHERPGPEQTAALRLAALLDGATFLGGRARALP